MQNVLKLIARCLFFTAGCLFADSLWNRPGSNDAARLLGFCVVCLLLAVLCDMGSEEY